MRRGAFLVVLALGLCLLAFGDLEEVRGGKGRRGGGGVTTTSGSFSFGSNRAGNSEELGDSGEELVPRQRETLQSVKEQLIQLAQSQPAVKAQLEALAMKVDKAMPAQAGEVNVLSETKPDNATPIQKPTKQTTLDSAKPIQKPKKKNSGTSPHAKLGESAARPGGCPAAFPYWMRNSNYCYTKRRYARGARNPGCHSWCCRNRRCQCSSAKVNFCSDRRHNRFKARVSRALSGGRCRDTPGWKNGSGFNCAAYKAKRWCANGKAVRGKEWTLTARFRYPARNCCVCGKPAGAAASSRRRYNYRRRRRARRYNYRRRRRYNYRRRRRTRRHGRHGRRHRRHRRHGGRRHRRHGRRSRKRSRWQKDHNGFDKIVYKMASSTFTGTSRFGRTGMMAIQPGDKRWLNKCGSTCQAAKKILASSKCKKKKTGGWKKSFANAENLFPDNVFPVLPPADKQGKINFNAKTSFGDCSKCPGWRNPVTGKTNPLAPGGGSIYKPVEINPGKGTGTNDNFYLEMRADVERKCGCAMCPPGTEFKDFRRNRWDLQVGANSCGPKSKRLYPRCKPWKGKSVRSYCWGRKCYHTKTFGGHFTNPEQRADQYTNESCCAAAPGSSYTLLFYKFTTPSKDTYSCHTAPKSKTNRWRGREYKVWNRMNTVRPGCGNAQGPGARPCDGVQFSPVSLDQLPRKTSDFGKCASPGGTAFGEMAATKRGFAYQKNVWATFKTDAVATPLFYIKCRVWKHVYCFTFNVPVTKWNKIGKARKCLTQKALGFDSAMQSRGGNRKRTARSIVVGLPAIETNNDYSWLKLMHLEVGICHGAALGA